MRKIRGLFFVASLALTSLGLVPVASAQQKVIGRIEVTNILPRTTLATRYFGNDRTWYEGNIPFFDCSDTDIQQIYYYRWKLYKSHLRDLGERGYIVTEFLDDVSWSLKPYESLNDATGFHIKEGRWLNDRHYVNDYIDFMYNGGNDRHFSEAIADAAYGTYLVNADRAFATKNREAMKRLYRQWDDHYDATKGLYFIEPLLDATEYTISSVDASGGKDGFRGGDSFRPSINAFMYANALAISKLSDMAGDPVAAKEFATKAATLRDLVQQNLWNENFQHFVDRYKVTNESVQYWDFIRGRELAGYTPWYFDLPDQNPQYVESWRHLLAADRLGGAYGLRTVEPSYPYYMKQYRYVGEDGINKPECQWNGPSWPFQTTLALGGLANLLNNYPRQTIIGADDYVRLLKQYARQHFQNGVPDLQEDYNPDTNGVIVGLHRSHHYNHSGYNDLVITGLVGLRPRADDILEVNPLIPTGPNTNNPITYFCLENVPYHGRVVTILYDRDGKHYKNGPGLSVYVDGQQLVKPAPLGKITVKLPTLTVPLAPATPALANLAVSLTRNGFPSPAASANSGDAYPAVDGRVWFYPNVRNYWTNTGSQSTSDWFSVDFGDSEIVNTARLYFYANGTQFKAPSKVTIQYWTGQTWTNVTKARNSSARPLENGETTIVFSPVKTSRLRAVFTNPRNASLALVELKAYGAKVVTPRPLVSNTPLGLADFEGENWHTGTFNGTAWVDATNGGFFSFDLKLLPDAANALVVKYWGSDTALGTAPRHFDIVVEGQVIATQTLQNNHPGMFFEMTYSLPQTLTQGKAKIKVRFQAKPGAIAGGVFRVAVDKK